MTAPRKQAPEDGLASPSFGACLLIRGGLELDFFKDLDGVYTRGRGCDRMELS